MSFEVRMKKRKKMIVLRVFCAIMIAAIMWFINLDFIRVALMQGGAYLLFIGFIGILPMVTSPIPTVSASSLRVLTGEIGSDNVVKPDFASSLF